MFRCLSLSLLLLLPLFGCAQLLSNRGLALSIKSGLLVTVNGAVCNSDSGTVALDGTLAVTGDITHEGAGNFTTGTGTLLLNGATQQTIGGSGTVRLHQLTANNSGAGVKLAGDLQIDSLLLLSNGNINLFGKHIQLDTTASISGETNTTRLMGDSGTIGIVQVLNAPTQVNPGNLGAIITSTANLDTVTIVRGVQAQTGAGNSGAKRYFDIFPGTNTGLNASLRFEYLPAELNGSSEPDLTLWRSTDTATTWVNRNGTVNAESNYVELAGIDAFSRWTVSDANAKPLPVEWLSFTAQLTPDRAAQLDWETASELNLAHFEVEHSTNGIDFQPIKRVAATASGATGSQYRLLDPNIKQGLNYYRIVETDVDGTTERSQIRVVQWHPTVEPLSVYPNPARIDGNITISGLQDGASTVQLINAHGQLVAAYAGDATDKAMQLQLTGSLAAGIYFCRVYQAGSIRTSKPLVIQAP